MTAAADSGEDRRVTIILIVAAVLLYLPGIWWGLPHATAPDRVFAWGSDELAPLIPVGELYRVFFGTEGPYNSQYPLLGYVLQAAMMAPYLAWEMVTGGLTRPSPVFPHGFTDPVSALATTTILARLVSLIAAAGVVLAARRTAAILWGRRAGVIAALLVLVTSSMFFYARTSNVDMAALFWSALGLAVFASCLRNGLTTRRAVWLGVLAAAATATKDAAFFVFLAMTPGLVPWRALAGAPGAPTRAKALVPIGAGIAAAAIAYVVASGLVFNPERYFLHVDWVVNSTAALLYPETLAGTLAFLGETTGHVVSALGLVASLAAVTGLAIAAAKDRMALHMALPAVAVFVGSILPVHFVNFRYVLPIAYSGTFFAAYAFDTLLRQRGARARSAALAALAVALFWGGVRGADLTWQMLDDSRYALADWFGRNARAGDRVGYWRGTKKLPALPAGVVTVETVSFCKADDWQSADAPEFVVTIPQQHFETEHEMALSDALYERFVDGSLGYSRVVRLRGPSLLGPGPVPFVNPLVQVFVRNDRLGQIPGSEVVSEVPGPLLKPLLPWLDTERAVPRGLASNPNVPHPCAGAVREETDGVPDASSRTPHAGEGSGPAWPGMSEVGG